MARKTAKKTGKRRSAAELSPRTEGQRQLLEVSETIVEIARALRTTKQSVSYWRRGEKTPGPAARAKLHELFGIDPAAWERQPGVTGGGSAPGINATSGKPTTLAEVEEQIAWLRELQKDVSLLASERVRLADSVGKLLAIKARLERDQELAEDRIVREHPFWARLKAGLLDALKPFPDATKAVTETLKRLSA